MGKKKNERLPRYMFRSWLRKRSSSPAASTIACQSNGLQPETLVGSNDLIIEKVLEHLSVTDLKNCRLVNSQWTALATTRAIQQHQRSVFFQYHYGGKRYDGLSELIKCAQNSAKFPITSFSFRGGDMCSDDAKEFFTVMGSSVKKLTLSAANNGTLCGKMNPANILSHTPNLVSLILDGGSHFDYQATDRLLLPALKSIKIDCQLGFANDAFELILNGAQNLETIASAWRLDDLTPIVTANKIHTVKSWCPSKFTFPAGLIQLATATDDLLKLTELNVLIGHDPADARVDTELLWKCFLKVLDQNTIHKLILNCTQYPAKFSFPLNMDSVKELVLMPSSNAPKGSRHFPSGSNLCTTFPRVNTLSLYDPLYHVCCAGREWANSFPLTTEFGDFEEILTTVTTLNLREESASVRMLRKMKKICPNVRSLEISIMEELDQKNIIWELCGEWRHLKKLTVELKHSNSKALDSIFTGIEAKHFESLVGDQSLTDGEKLKKVEDTRHVLWLGNLSGLTQLDIKYKIPFSYRLDDGETLIPLTRYSGLFAFNLMPNITVNLRCVGICDSKHDDELKAALHSISSFVTIRRCLRY